MVRAEHYRTIGLSGMDTVLATVLSSTVVQQCVLLVLDAQSCVAKFCKMWNVCVFV